MTRILLLAVLLAPSLAAARYDPSTDRATLRQTATACHATIVDATGLPLEKEKVPDIIKGLDEGLRLSRLASDTASSLDAAAKARAKEMSAVTDGLDRRLKGLTEPVAAQRKRYEDDASELSDYKQKIEKLPEEDREKYKPRVAKAEESLKAANEALGRPEGASLTLGQRALEMKRARKQGLKALDEVSAASTDTVNAAGGLPAPAAAVKEKLAVLDQPPVETARARAREKIELARAASLALFQAADRACNRADDLRRWSSDFADASEAFEATWPATNPSSAKGFLDEAETTLTLIRELLKKKP